MVGRRGETPLVPPYKFHRPNKALALPHRLLSLRWLGILPPLFWSDLPTFELLETPSCVSVLLPRSVVWSLAV